MPLSDSKLRALKAGPKSYRMSDAEGLFIQVNPNGTKLWRMAYRFAGKQKALSFGVYPTVTLLEARRLRDEAKRTLAAGEDPARVKKIEKLEAEIEQATFRSVGDRWFKINESRWVLSYAVRLRARLVGDIYPEFGHVPIGDIRPQEVLAAIRKIEARGAIEMGRRIYQMVGNIFKFAVAEGMIASDPTRDIKGALAPPNPVKHRIAVKADDLPQLIQDVLAYEGDPVTPLALRFVLHTFVRTNELRLAEWTEFENLDGTTPLWRIPPEKMKIRLRDDHIVPLSKQAAEIIRAVREINGERPWVFASPVSGKEQQPISNNTLIYALYRMGYYSRATVHGFRSTASTILNEHQFNRDWIELQLAHVDASVRGVYNAALYLPHRTKMMQWWSDYLEPRKQEAPEEMFSDLLG